VKASATATEGIGQLVSFKIPCHTIVLDEFRMTACGKPQNWKLMEMVAQKLNLKGV
jgi:hypothetical protein